MKPKFKPPGTKRLKLKCGILLSTSAFKINLRRYTLGAAAEADAAAAHAAAAAAAAANSKPGPAAEVGRCRSTLSNRSWNCLELSP
jgi:hypothetical protein